MTRSELIKDIKQFVGGASWINRKQIAEYLGCDRTGNPVTDAIRGLPKYGSKYCVLDVADNIFSGYRS